MSALSVQEIENILLKDNEEFARIYRKHRELDEQITKLEELRHLTPEEEVQEKTMKKDKLRLKDQLADMINQYQAQQ
ncbi:DUF465 domain-containing protein [candidate division KSB3 bacterium]|uniref:DUF465 domain-containing protein n=1 Tax=candidate division KSB3 bacterium TaxID=2044937 RepID=A0A2G6KEX8_9BACT|nr:MAG: DUF465 domain-containing protein [candidate division KSB3 bacterium]